MAIGPLAYGGEMRREVGWESLAQLGGFPARSSRPKAVFREESRLANGYAVTGIVLSRWSRTKPGASGGSITARSSGPWLGPLGGWEEAAHSHPLVPTGHGGRRPPVTLMTIRSGDSKSVNFLYRPQPSTCLTTLDNHQNSDRQSLKAFSSYGGRCWQCGLLRKNVP